MTINPKGYIVLLLDKNPEQVSRKRLNGRKKRVWLLFITRMKIYLLIYKNQSKGFAIGRSDLNNTDAFFTK